MRAKTTSAVSPERKQKVTDSGGIWLEENKETNETEREKNSDDVFYAI